MLRQFDSDDCCKQTPIGVGVFLKYDATLKRTQSTPDRWRARNGKVMARSKATSPEQVAEQVKSYMQVIGGKTAMNAALIDISPSIADTLLVTAETTAAAASEQRAREAHLSQVLTESQVNLDKVKRGEAMDFYGPSVASPAQDAYAAVERGKHLLKQQVRTFEAEFHAQLDTHDVRMDFAEWSRAVAANEENILALQTANEAAADALKKALTMTDTLKNISRSSGANSLRDRSGNRIAPAESIERHKKLADALEGAA